MKKVEKVSIGRYAFALEEDAFAVVNKYLNELELFYSDKEGGSEIMEGIEERMAELFIEKCGAGGVVSLAAVNQTIEILGKPETIEDSGEEEEKKYQYNDSRKLYRDPNHKVLGGVCSGLAAYFNVDVLLVRIIFVVGFICFSTAFHFILPWIGTWLFPLIYILLWIVVPEAKTVSEQYKMRGEKGTLDDIVKNVEAGAKEMGQRAKELGDSNFWKGLGRVVGAIIGVIFILLGIVGLMAGAFAFLGIEVALSALIADWLQTYSPTFASAVPMIWSKIVVMLVYFIPFVAILYSGLQLAFDFKSPKWRPGLVLFIIWLIAVVALCCLCSASIFLF